MRTKLSSTAHESDSEVQTPVPYRNADWTIEKASHRGCESLPSHEGLAQEDEGLLHDVRNLVSAVALYCDLLSMPHVLRPEHRHYADELRLLGQRSTALVERLIGFGVHRDRSISDNAPLPTRDCRALQSAISSAREERPRVEGLRPMVERCAGLLRCVTSGQPIDIVYGDASARIVRVPAESLERILVNLVRNAAAAMGRRRGQIRVHVGVPPGDALRTRPWPFQCVRLMVEDSGCGMAPAEVEQLLLHSDPAGPQSHSLHGIGFRVVRELVEASRGELSIQSWPGEGTRVEIEWPVAQIESHESEPGSAGAMFASETRRSA